VSNVASAQWTDGSSIDWVEFPPVAHTHLVRCAIKLAPSVPAAKVKRVMFVYLLEVLNDDGPVSSFFAPRRARTPRKRRTRKPREGGDQPVSAMAVDTPPPVAPSQPDLPGPLSPGLVPGDGDPSSEEPAGDGFNVTFGQASSSPGVSPTPSDRTVVPVAPSRPGPSRPPSVLGVKRSLPPASPSPPSSPPSLPSSPPSRVGTQGTRLPQDWRDWIASCQLAAGRRGKSFRVTSDDILMAARDSEDYALRLEREDMERSLLRQVDNAGPPAPMASPPVAAPSLAPVAPPLAWSVPPLLWAFVPDPRTCGTHALHILQTQLQFRRDLLSGPASDRLQWLRDADLPKNLVIPPP